MGPSNADKAEMARLLKIMNGGEGGGSVPAVQQPQQAHYSGGYAGTQRPLHESRAPAAPAYMPSFGTSREEVDAMKNILNKLNALDGGESSAPQRQPQALVESNHFHQNVPIAGGAPYEVLISLRESNGKEFRSYNVVDNQRRDLVSDLKLQESAQAIMKLMNKGLAFESSRVQEVVELEEEFSRYRKETVSHKSRYQRSMELGETAAAEVFKTRFNVAKANALAAQDQIKSILESIR
jgi:hypothetical protein